MGIVNELIGGIVAEEALDKADPNANLIEKGLAFVGENAIQNELGGLFGKKPEGAPADADQPAADDQSNN